MSIYRRFLFLIKFSPSQCIDASIFSTSYERCLKYPAGPDCSLFIAWPQPIKTQCPEVIPVLFAWIRGICPEACVRRRFERVSYVLCEKSSFGSTLPKRPRGSGHSVSIWILGMYQIRYFIQIDFWVIYVILFDIFYIIICRFSCRFWLTGWRRRSQASFMERRFVLPWR